MSYADNPERPRSQGFEELLFENATKMGSRQEEQPVATTTTKIVRWWERKSVLIIGIFLALFGVMGVWKCPSKLGQRLSEAFLIAGVLSLSVDLYLKRKLQEEAARDIFHHLLGINLPIELRNKLQEFVTENRIYRKNVCILADAKEIDGGVELKIIVKATVIAAKCEHYCQSLEAEEPLEARIICASLRSPTKSFYQVKNITMKTNHEPMVVEWKGSEKTLSKDDELISYIQYAVRGKPKDFYVIFFGTSVIDATVRVTASDGLEIFASKPDIKNGNEYVYKKVFLRGDHIQIRWRPKPSISTGVIAGEGPGTRESG